MGQLLTITNGANWELEIEVTDAGVPADLTGNSSTLCIKTSGTFSVNGVITDNKIVFTISSSASPAPDSSGAIKREQFSDKYNGEYEVLLTKSDSTVQLIASGKCLVKDTINPAD